MSLSQGDRGDGVRSLQQALRDAGFNPGPIDGIYGPLTANAVRQYQAANDLAANGRADDDLLVKLGLQKAEEDAKSDEGELGLSIPGEPELWLVGGETWLVYTIPGTEDDPIQVAWRSPSDEDTQSFFGPGQKIVYDREISAADFDSLGVIDFGSTDELANMEEDPWTTWTQTLETESHTQPWILDADYQALMAMAILEGRSLTAAEIASTRWWSENNVAQRQWMTLFHGDPMTAEQMREDYRIRTAQALVDAGMGTSTPQAVIEYMADQFVMGNWSQNYFEQQIKAISDPQSGFAIEAGLSEVIGNTQLTTTIDQVDEVERLVRNWLGPQFGNWSDDQVNDWAGKLRNDPDGRDRLVAHLQKQRIALFPQYEDASLTYEDIASPWRQFVRSAWGEMPDETDDAFVRVLQLNDSVEAGRFLRKEGRKRGNKKVLEDTLGAMLSSGKSTLRRAI